MLHLPDQLRHEETKQMDDPCIRMYPSVEAHLTCGSGLGPGHPSLTLPPLVENVVKDD